MADKDSGERRVPNKVRTGDFRFCEAMMHGRVVRDGPERRSSESGDRIEATILIGLWDSRQRAERDKPVFVRVKAFANNNPEAFQALEACERLDRVSVAGNLFWNAWEDRDGNIRQELQLLADHVLREDRFPSLKSLLEPDEPGTGEEEAGTASGAEQSDDDIPF